jgi:Txe/YoeB family toxin of toxin-antitoxin system
VVSWRVVFTKQAEKDAQDLKASGLAEKAKKLVGILRCDPNGNPPSFEKLVGNLAGAYSRRINLHNRLVYEILKEERTVRVLRMFTHEYRA